MNANEQDDLPEDEQAQADRAAEILREEDYAAEASPGELARDAWEGGL
jgi:hypothetical protein